MTSEPRCDLLPRKTGERNQQVVVGRRRVEIALEVVEQDAKLSLREALQVAERDRRTLQRDGANRNAAGG